MLREVGEAVGEVESDSLEMRSARVPGWIGVEGSIMLTTMRGVVACAGVSASTSTILTRRGTSGKR